MLISCYIILLCGVILNSISDLHLGNMQENIAWKQNSQERQEIKIKKLIETQDDIRALDVHKADDPFGLAAISLDSKKHFKFLQILQDNLSLTKLKYIERFLKVDTIVLYGFPEKLFEYWPMLKDDYPPLLILNDTLHWKPTDHFSRNFLSIVFLEAKRPSADQVLVNLKQFLKGCHLNKIIFIKENFNRANDTDVVQLFNWLHANGFWQSMLMDFIGNSVVLQHFTGEFMWNLPFKEFLLQTTNWHNLHGYPIICSMANNPPEVFIQYDSQHKVVLMGYFGDFINLFVQYYNASLEPFVLSDLDYYTKSDCAKNIKSNTVDICADGLPIHDQYVTTYPDEIVDSYLMIPYDRPLPRFFYFLKPFHLHVWTVVICSSLYKVISLSFIHRLQHGSWNSGLQMLYAVLSVLHLPFQLIHIKGGYRRFLEILMISVGFVVATWYLSVLSSLLFTRLYFHDIKTLQDLVYHNISIMVDEFEEDILNNTEVDPIIKQQLLVVSSEVLLQHRRNLDPQYAYYSQYEKVDFYLYQQKFLLHPRMKVLTGMPPINEIMGGIPMNPNWPFQHLLNIFTIRIFHYGLNRPIQDNAMKQGISSGYLQFFPTEYHCVEPLSIEYFQMPAILLAVGYTLAIICFLSELLLFRRNLMQ